MRWKIVEEARGRGREKEGKNVEGREVYGSVNREERERESDKGKGEGERNNGSEKHKNENYLSELISNITFREGLNLN